MGHLPGGVVTQGILPPAQAPVVQQGPFTQGVDLHHVVDAAPLGELARGLSLGNDPAQQAVVDALVIQQVPFPVGYQLGGQEPGQQVHGDAVFNHAEQGAVTASRQEILAYFR